MTQLSKPQNDTTDREIIITRLLNAPRELVFDAFTDAEHLINWWGPTGFTNTFLSHDVRPGGEWNFIMHGPDGTDFKNQIVYEDVVRPSYLAYQHGSGEADDRGFYVTVTFEDVAGKTNLTMKSVFQTAEERDMVVKEYGAIEGGNQTIDKLEAELIKMSDGR
ncbi:MAG: SRPBCC family protein [Mucilaginibacter sp.]|uniref:SRPBCC family protein n=1 Tax=Mucilaginibacter sp. TaxID=1882438 RepID=UPI003266C7FA